MTIYLSGTITAFFEPEQIELLFSLANQKEEPIMEILIERDSTGSGVWATYDDPVLVWAWGKTEDEAKKRLRKLVPFPYQTGDSTHASELFEDTEGNGFACWEGSSYAIAAGVDSDDALDTLVAHVPVPQSTGSAGGDKPPKLEDSPLPPV